MTNVIKDGTGSGYLVKVDDPQIRTKCNIVASEAERWITAGASGTIDLAANQVLENPRHVRFSVPEAAPICLISYKIMIYPIYCIFYCGQTADFINNKKINKNHVRIVWNIW